MTSTVAGKPVKWHQDIYAILAKHGATEADILDFRKAIARKDASAIERLRQAFEGPVQVFEDAVSAAASTVNRNVT